MSIEFELSPDVPDYLHITTSLKDLTSPISFFQCGQLVVVERPPFDVDLESLRAPVSRADFPAVIKKSKFQDLTLEIGPERPDHLLTSNRSFFYEDEEGAKRFQWALASLDLHMQLLAQELYPSIDFSFWEGITYRPSITSNEGLHVDSYMKGQAIDFSYIRLFYNIDDEPRVWHVSFRVEELIVRYSEYIRRFLRSYSDQDWTNANCLNRILVACLPWQEIPKHRIVFPPGSFWMVDTQAVSHEIVYGKKLVAASYRFGLASLPDQQMTIQSKVDRALAEAGLL